MELHMDDQIEQSPTSTATPPPLPSGLTAGVWVGHGDGTDEGAVPPPGPSRPRRRQGVMVGALLVVLALLAAALGITWLRREPTFCERIADLPALSSSLDEDGSPGGALVRYADALDLAALGAPDVATAEAAATVAEEQRALGQAVGGVASSQDVVDQVARLDSKSAREAHERLDAAIQQHCS